VQDLRHVIGVGDEVRAERPKMQSDQPAAPTGGEGGEGVDRIAGERGATR